MMKMSEKRVLDEYLGKYADDEYVYMYKYDKFECNYLLVILRLMEKTTYRYCSEISFDEKSGAFAHMVEYDNGTTKILGYCGGMVYDKFRDRKEIKKIGYFFCKHVEVIDILGGKDKILCHKSIDNSNNFTIKKGDIVDKEMFVFTSKRLYREVSIPAIKRIVMSITNDSIV